MYDINGKVYTDATFVDEMVYNIKIILGGIVVKNSETADINETEDSIRQSDIYLSIIRGNRKFELFDYTYEHLTRIIRDPNISEEDLIRFEINNELIPNEYREQLFDIASEEFMNNYEELNNYYRTLNGLPDYGADGIYVSEDIIPSEIKDLVDISKPIHEMDDYQIGLLESYGVLSIIQRENPADLYLLHLGNKRISIFDARTAGKFDILYIPTEAEASVSNRFRELYEKEKIIYFKRHYSLAYKFNSDYYDEFFIIMLLSQTATDLISEIPEWYIRRDIFDARTIETLLESNGVRYFEQIPLKYQIALVRYLNKIIKFKSCNKNIYDLINIFDYDDVVVYKHYLVKNRLSDEDGNYVTAEDIKDMYELFFVRVPLDGTLADSITSNINIESYNTIVTEDPYWNGPEDHDYIYESILKKNFTSQATKYMSLEVKFDIKDYQFQSVYFLNMLFNNKIDTSELKLEVPIINTSTTFKLTDLFVLLFIVSFTFYDKTSATEILNDNRDCIDSVLNFGKHPVGDYDVLLEDRIPLYTDETTNGGYSKDIDPYNECDGGYAFTSTEDDTDGGLLAPFNLDADGKYAWEDEEDLYDFNGGNCRTHTETVNANGNEEKPLVDIYKDHINPHKDLCPCTIFKDDVDKLDLMYEIDMSNRILGFNPDADLDYLEFIVNNRHSSFGFNKGYTLEELGVDKFVTPLNNSIKTPTQLMEIYNTNKEIYDNLYNKIVNCNSEDEYRVYTFVFNYLFTMEMNEDYYIMNNGRVARTYLEYIKNNNVIIYNFYQQLMKEEDERLRKSNISTYIDQVIDSIDLYLNTNLPYLYYSVATRSWNSTMEYLSLLINFFKSYKVQFLDIAGTLVFSNEIDDSAKLNDKITAKDIQLERGHQNSILDEAHIESELSKEEKYDIRDDVRIYNSYDNKFYDMNGDKSTTKLSYIGLDGNKSCLDGSTDLEEDYLVDIDDESEYDGGCSFDAYDDSFIDLDGVDASYIEDEDDSYIIEYDWNGGDSTYHYTELIMDNGTAIEQRFYADYCPNDRDYRFPDEVNYNPIYQGYTCDGRYSEEELRYWQGNAMSAAIPANEIRYELDGGRSYAMDPKMYVMYLDYLNNLNEKAQELNKIAVGELEYYKVDPMYSYNEDFEYYILNDYTGEMELALELTIDNYEQYVNNGLYYSIECAILNTEAMLTAYEYTLSDLWEEFTSINNI